MVVVQREVQSEPLLTVECAGNRLLRNQLVFTTLELHHSEGAVLVHGKPVVVKPIV